jgi:hypothetical protein
MLGARRKAGALLTSVAAMLALGAQAPTAGAANPTLVQAGRLPLTSPCIARTAMGVDASLGVVIVAEEWQGNGTPACDTRPSTDRLLVRAFSSQSLALLSERVLTIPATAVAFLAQRQVTIDESRHRFFLYFPTNSNGGTSYVLGFSTTELQHGGGALPTLSEIPIPGAVAQASAGSPTDVTPARNPTGAAGDLTVIPTAMTYDATSDSLYLMLAQNWGNIGSATSAHGSGAHDVYVARVPVSAASVAWIQLLDQCANSVKMTTNGQNSFNADDPIAVGHSAGKAFLVAGCVFTRSPTVIGQDQAATIVQMAGSMLSYTIPLDAGNRPVSGAIAYSIGRPNVLGGVADAGTGRIFWPAMPPALQGASSGSGPAAVVFDAVHGVYVGAPSVGGPGDLSGVIMLATGGGRYYAASRAGITVGDTSATPPGQGVLVSSHQCPTRALTVDPTRRLLFIRQVTDCKNEFSGQAPYIDVLRDELPNVSPPSAPAPDSYTTQINEAPGATVGQFNGHAEATGSRVRMVGGPSGFASGATFSGYDIVFSPNNAGSIASAPLDGTSREVAMGVVRASNLDSYQASSNATAATSDDASANQLATTPGGQTWPFKEIHCSDPGSKSAGGDDSSDTAVIVKCDKAGDTTSADSSAGPMGLSVKLAGQGPGANLPVSVAQSVTSTHVYLDPAKGMVSESHAISRGINTGVATIDSVESTMRCWAHGRTGTASCTFNRLVSGAASGGKPVAGGACVENDTPAGAVGTCGALLNALNLIQPGQVVFNMPDPDISANTFKGSPGGYQSVGKRELYEHLQDDVLNYDASNLVPGLEVTYVNDSGYNPSRLNLQLAGTEAESHYGIHPASAADGLGADSGAAINSASTLGIPPFQTSLLPIGPAVSAVAPVVDGPWTAIHNIVRRVFDGIGVLLRSPLTGLVVLTLLLLMASPLGIAWRRRCLLIALSGG